VTGVRGGHPAELEGETQGVGSTAWAVKGSLVLRIKRSCYCLGQGHHVESHIGPSKSQAGNVESRKVILSLLLTSAKKSVRLPEPESQLQVFPKGLSFVSNRQRRKEGTFCASELAGIEPAPPAPEEQGMRAFRQLG
jgi:hypothetical protein